MPGIDCGIGRYSVTGTAILQSSSRRRLLRGAAAWAIAHSLAGAAPLCASAPRRAKLFAYVGTYTGAAGSGSNGEGIYLFEMDQATGELTLRGLAAPSRNPSWIVIHPSSKFLYAVNEIADYHGDSGAVSAFAANAANGEFRALNTVSSEGAGPAYLSIDYEGRFAFVANYGGGSIAVLPILVDGSVGPSVNIHSDVGLVGPARAVDRPSGSFAMSGHDAPHAHMIAPDPQSRFVLATDLGQDRIYSYRLDAETGKLIPSSLQPFTALPAGDGPRHFAFHPNGRWLYSIQEEASTVVFFRYNAATGKLTPEQTISTLPPNFPGTSFASEVLVAPNGRYLYAANRLHDAIAAFAIAANGRLMLIGETSAMGDYPSQCRIDPSGRFLYTCNRRSDCITCFRLHPQTGLPAFTGQYTPAGSPACITFLA